MPTYPTNRWMTTYDFALLQNDVVAEQAQFSLHHGGTSYEPTDDQLNSIAQGAYLAWAHNVDQDRWTDAVVLRGTKSFRYNAAGHVIGIGSFAPSEPWIGTASGPSLPWETALAVSLYSYERGTFVPDPRRRRGRIYLPPMAADVLDSSNTGFFDNGQITDFFGEIATFLGESGDDALGVALAPLVVFSRTAEQVYQVTDLYLDAKFDSQRRREHSQPAGKLHLTF